ncbi:hypothetical protein [Streptomyces viridochromogenes]|uniref:hypothetical protein n=1 Tax=Streptomyces viridochromogenes TaxID=1938 RepID=UPI001319C939|nr:hypothetical protein [Streptomyces viridochromogenes]
MRRPPTGAILAAAADAGVQRISTGSDGTQLPVPASGGTVSADGRYAAFTAADLVPDDTNGMPDVFIDHIH